MMDEYVPTAEEERQANELFRQIEAEWDRREAVSIWPGKIVTFDDPSKPGAHYDHIF